MTIRPVRASDHAGINRLHRDVWWPERSSAGWRWLAANPARQEIGAPLGWVVEGADGEPAAFLGNFVQRFWHGEQILHGTTGFSTIVPEAVRGASRPLFRALLAQTGLFAHYTFNANPRSAPLYPRFGLKAWPEPTHALKLSWTVDRATLLLGRLLREAVVRSRGRIPYRSERFVTRRLRGPGALILPDDVTVLSDLSDASPYAAFWETLKGQGTLVADRSPALLHWRLADPDLTLRPVLLAYRVGDRITGYAMAYLSKGTSIEPAFLEIVDLIALDSTPEAIPVLARTLIANARTLGAAKVRIQMVSPAMLSALGPVAAHARHEGGWGHCHVRFADEALAASWSPTPFDGDYGLCLRPVPMGSWPARG